MTDDKPLIQPRIEREMDTAPRLELRLPLPVKPIRPSSGLGPSTLMLMLSGFAILALGFACLETGNFIIAEFARATWLGWLTLGIAVLGFGLVMTGIVRELLGLAQLHAVDALRRDLSSADPSIRVQAARRWLTRIEEGNKLRPALDALNDPDAVMSLLRTGVENRLRAQCDSLSKRAAVQVVAGIAATPTPALVVLLVTWRATRLIRQIAQLYGVRPGFLATLSLLRRTALSATATAITEAAVNTAAHAVLSSPLLTHIAGDMAGGAVAARRLIVLGRATGAACSPLPPE